LENLKGNFHRHWENKKVSNRYGSDRRLGDEVDQVFLIDAQISKLNFDYAIVMLRF